MKESTKKLLNAPWNAVHACYVTYAVNEVKDAFGNTICQVRQFKEGERLAILPELYDALAEAVEEACQDCVDETYQRTGMLFEPVKDGCIYPERDCCPKCRSWIALLEKVRDCK